MKTRVLVVEDEAIVAMQIREYLQALDYECVGDCASGAEAIRAVGELRPDLVLMDIVLKGAEPDGITAAKEISDRFGIPVVYLTAHTDMATVERAKITRPFGYVVKPFSEADLRVAVEIAIYQGRMEKKLKEREEWFRTTLNSLGEAVIAVNEEGQITFLNPVAETLLGVTEREWSQANAIDVFNIVSEGAPGSVTKCGVLRGRRGYVLSAGGEKIPVTYTSSPIIGDTKEVKGIVIVFTKYSPGSERKGETQGALSSLPERQEVSDRLIHG